MNLAGKAPELFFSLHFLKTCKTGSFANVYMKGCQISDYLLFVHGFAISDHDSVAMALLNTTVLIGYYDYCFLGLY